MEVYKYFYKQDQDYFQLSVEQRKHIVQILKDFSFFSTILRQQDGESILYRLTDSIRFEEYKKGKAIFHLGQEGTSIYFIIQGSVSIYLFRNEEDVNQHSLLLYQLYKLNSQLLYETQKEQTENENVIKDLQNQISDLSQQIQKCKFNNSDSQFITQLDIQQQEDDENLLRIDPKNEKKYFLNTQNQICQVRKVSEKRVGDQFGEGYLLNGNKRSATVVASSDLQVLTIRGSIYREIVGMENNKLFFILSAYKNLLQLEILKYCIEIGYYYTEETVDLNQYIFKEGEQSQFIFVIHYGQVSLQKKQNKKNVQILVLTQGDIFGYEDAYNHQFYTYDSVSISHKTIFYKINKQIIDQVLPNRKFQQALESIGRGKLNFYEQRLKNIDTLQENQKILSKKNSIKQKFAQVCKNNYPATFKEAIINFLSQKQQNNAQTIQIINNKRKNLIQKMNQNKGQQLLSEQQINFLVNRKQQLMNNDQYIDKQSQVFCKDITSQTIQCGDNTNVTIPLEKYWLQENDDFSDQFGQKFKKVMKEYNYQIIKQQNQSMMQRQPTRPKVINNLNLKKLKKLKKRYPTQLANTSSLEDIKNKSLFDIFQNEMQAKHANDPLTIQTIQRSDSKNSIVQDQNYKTYNFQKSNRNQSYGSLIDYQDTQYNYNDDNINNKSEINRKDQNNIQLRSRSSNCILNDQNEEANNSTSVGGTYSLIDKTLYKIEQQENKINGIFNQSIIKKITQNNFDSNSHNSQIIQLQTDIIKEKIKQENNMRNDYFQKIKNIQQKPIHSKFKDQNFPEIFALKKSENIALKKKKHQFFEENNKNKLSDINSTDLQLLVENKTLDQENLNNDNKQVNNNFRRNRRYKTPQLTIKNTSKTLQTQESIDQIDVKKFDLSMISYIKKLSPIDVINNAKNQNIAQKQDQETQSPNQDDFDDDFSFSNNLKQKQLDRRMRTLNSKLCKLNNSKYKLLQKLLPSKAYIPMSLFRNQDTYTLNSQKNYNKTLLN